MWPTSPRALTQSVDRIFSPTIVLRECENSRFSVTIVVKIFCRTTILSTAQLTSWTLLSAKTTSKKKTRIQNNISSIEIVFLIILHSAIGYGRCYFISIKGACICVIQIPLWMCNHYVSFNACTVHRTVWHFYLFVRVVYVRCTFRAINVQVIDTIYTNKYVK